VFSVNTRKGCLQIECIRGNILGTVDLADVCNAKGLHMTYFGTGCIFHYDDEFTVESGKVCAYFNFAFVSSHGSLTRRAECNLFVFFLAPAVSA
jgi:hypothetical protein